MLPAVTRTATAAIIAAAMAAASVAPAHALGKNERNFLKGVAAAVIVNEIVKQGRAQAAPVAPAPRYFHDPRQAQAPRHVQRQYPPRTVPAPVHQGTTAAYAFQEYSPQSRRLIQQRLAAYGYYRGAIDGLWGPGTSAAVQAYARDVNASGALTTRDGTVRLYNGLIG